MSDWRLTSGSDDYKEALTATTSLGAPAVGFAKLEDVTDRNEAVKTIIKQNNTLIQLLVQIKQELDDCKASVKEIQQKLITQKEPKSQITDAISNLEANLKRLSLGEPAKPKPRPKGPIYVFKDPLKILEEEKKKGSK